MPKCFGLGPGEDVMTLRGVLVLGVFPCLGRITSDSDGNLRAGVATNFGLGTFGSLAPSQHFNRPITLGAGSRRSERLHPWQEGTRFMGGVVDTSNLATAMGCSAATPRPALSTRN